MCLTTRLNSIIGKLILGQAATFPNATIFHCSETDVAR